MNEHAARPRRRIRLLWLVGAAFVLFAFLHGPSGLVSIIARGLQVRRLKGDIQQLHKEIAERTARRDWLANPDSAAKYAHELLDSEPAATSPTTH